MDKAAFTQWFSNEFPLFSIKITERKILGSDLTQLWFSTIDDFKNVPHNIDLNAPNLLMFDYWHKDCELVIGGHSNYSAYKANGATFRKQNVKSDSDFFAKVQTWLLKNKAVILTMA